MRKKLVLSLIPPLYYYAGGESIRKSLEITQRSKAQVETMRNHIAALEDR